MVKLINGFPGKINNLTVGQFDNLPSIIPFFNRIQNIHITNISVFID